MINQFYLKAKGARAMSDLVAARLKEMRELVSDNWFLDNPNDDVNDEITALIDALEELQKENVALKNDYQEAEDHIRKLAEEIENLKERLNVK